MHKCKGSQTCYQMSLPSFRIVNRQLHASCLKPCIPCKNGGANLSFLFPNESSGCDNNFGARYEASTKKHGLVISRAGSIGSRFLFTYRPYEEGLLVLIQVEGAQQLGNSTSRWVFLWATPKRRLVVMANHASRKVSDLVLPAPKTPAVAKVDRPDCRAATMDRAMDMM